MPRHPRADLPGTWHHVMNRGIARRTLFERRDDFRFFLAQLARAVRRGEIEVHAFCLMATHYHLLLRSPRGELASAMHSVQLAYSRRFNRSRRRDGTLVRGRYTSKLVTSLTYRSTLVRYIDANPLRAGVVGSAQEYPYGSALLYRRPKGPRWLSREWIEETVRLRAGAASYAPGDYSRVLGGISEGAVEMIEARSSRADGPDPLDDLVEASPDRVRAWMVRKARLGDGTRPGLPILSLRRLGEIIAEGRHEPWTIERGRTERDAWTVAYVGLGRELCGASLAQLAEDVALSESGVSRLQRIHRQATREVGEYARRAARLTQQALADWRGVWK